MGDVQYLLLKLHGELANVVWCVILKCCPYNRSGDDDSLCVLHACWSVGLEVLPYRVCQLLVQGEWTL